MRTCAYAAAFAVLMACAGAMPGQAQAQAGGKDKIGMPGGGCDRDFAAKPGEAGASAMGGCDDAMFNDGTRGVSKRPKASGPAEPTVPSSKSGTPDRKRKSGE